MVRISFIAGALFLSARSPAGHAPPAHNRFHAVFLLPSKIVRQPVSHPEARSLKKTVHSLKPAFHRITLPWVQRVPR
jgi:hypothetical protein